MLIMKRFDWLKRFTVEFKLTNQRALFKEHKERTFPITTSAYLPGHLTSRAPHLRGPKVWDPFFTSPLEVKLALHNAEPIRSMYFVSVIETPINFH